MGPGTVVLLIVTAVVGYICARFCDGVYTEYKRERAKPLDLSPWCSPEEAPIRMPRLIITPRCPEGYSAKDILGYRDLGGKRHSHSYPGGFTAWNRMHGFNDDEEE